MTEPSLYPFEGDTRLDLDARYAKLRADEPVSRVRMPNGEEAWLVTRYADIKAVLTDGRFHRSLVDGQDMTVATRGLVGMERSATLPMTDPPGHTEIRRLVVKAFTARRIEGLRDHTQVIVDGLLDNMKEAGSPADLVRHLALPLPISVIAELLGIPQPDHGRVRAWVDALLSVIDLPAERIQEAKTEFETYMTDVVAQRRNNPGDDLISDLLRVREQDDKLTEDELLSLVMLLFVAGYETTVSQLSNFAYTLLTHPNLWSELQDDTALLPQAIEELIRFVPLGFAGLPVRAVEDVRFHDVLIRAGDFVLLPKSSGNRDELVFERPDEIDFHRGRNLHLGSGHGAHYCLGAQLARMEIQTAIGALLRRSPG